MLIVWDLTTGQVLRRETIGLSPVRSVAFLGESRDLLAAEERRDGSIVLFDPDGTEPVRRVVQPHGWNRFVVDAKRQRAIVGDFDGGLSVVSLPDLAIVRRLENAHDGMVWSLALSGDGKLLAAGHAKGRVILRDAATLEPLLTFPTWIGAVKDLAFDATGRWLAIAGTDSDVGVWDLSLLREELSAVGLAWDRPAPAAASAADRAAGGGRPGPHVPVIRPGHIDPADALTGHQSPRLVNPPAREQCSGRVGTLVARDEPREYGIAALGRISRFVSRVGSRPEV
jgi:hypothetical protein